MIDFYVVFFAEGQSAPFAFALLLLEQQLEKGFSYYESVPDFVSDPGGEGSERGQAVRISEPGFAACAGGTEGGVAMGSPSVMPNQDG